MSIAEEFPDKFPMFRFEQVFEMERKDRRDPEFFSAYLAPPPEPV